MRKKPIPAEIEWDGYRPIVCCIRTGFDETVGEGYYGQLTFRCPWCGDLHFHGSGGPKLGDGDGERVPHCCENPKRIFGYLLREVKDAYRAGTMPKRILTDFQEFKKAGFRIPESWCRRRPNRDSKPRV